MLNRPGCNPSWVRIFALVDERYSRAAMTSTRIPLQYADTLVSVAPRAHPFVSHPAPSAARLRPHA
jgi:hypothetical protein